MQHALSTEVVPWESWTGGYCLLLHLHSKHIVLLIITLYGAMFDAALMRIVVAQALSVALRCYIAASSSCSCVQRHSNA